MQMRRRGFTLIELLVSLVVAAILGAGVTKLLLSSNRFEERTESLRSARRVSRAAVAALSNDMRMVDPAWGIESASATSLTLRIPYALGMVCRITGTPIIMVLPVDSLAFATPGYSGVALRASDGSWGQAGSGALTELSTWPSSCTSAGITAIAPSSSAPNQRTRTFEVAPGGVGSTPLTVGAVVILYRRTRFYFGASGQAGLTGRTALWRHYLDGAGGAVELAAPFDPGAAFRFYDLASTTAQVGVPSPLTNTRGIEFYLPGESDRTARLRAAPEQADLTTSVFFVNRMN